MTRYNVIQGTLFGFSWNLSLTMLAQLRGPIILAQYAPMIAKHLAIGISA